jgi:F-type H+-transporting ATPase subunit b
MTSIILMNPLITPDPGLAIWAILIFSILLFLLSKFAFRPIVNSLKERQDSIETALNAANKAKEEMAQLQSKNEDLLREAKEERNKMLLEAKDIANKTMDDARERAKVEYAKLIDNARKDFEAERVSALMQMKNEAGKLAVDIAEKLVKKELSDKKAQEDLVSSLINEAKFN